MSELRPGMERIVAQIRRYGQASRTDEFNGETFWTDDQLQEIADTRSERLMVKLMPVASSGYTIYTLKNAPRHYWYEVDTVGVLEVSADATLTVVPTAFVYDPVRAEFTFSEPLNHRYEYVAEGYATNIYLSLADLWEQKAAQRFDYVDFKAGNNKVNMAQEHAHCLAMMQHYRNRITRRHERTTSGRWA